jgi:hypothetical protein
LETCETTAHPSSTSSKQPISRPHFPKTGKQSKQSSTIHPSSHYPVAVTQPTTSSTPPPSSPPTLSHAAAPKPSLSRVPLLIRSPRCTTSRTTAPTRSLTGLCSRLRRCAMHRRMQLILAETQIRSTSSATLVTVSILVLSSSQLLTYDTVTTTFSTWRRWGLPERDANDTPYEQMILDYWYVSLLSMVLALLLFCIMLMGFTGPLSFAHTPLTPTSPTSLLVVMSTRPLRSPLKVLGLLSRLLILLEEYLSGRVCSCLSVTRSSVRCWAVPLTGLFQHLSVSWWYERRR